MNQVLQVVIQRCLNVLVLLEGAFKHIDDDVSVANIDQHIVFENKGLLLSHKNAVSHTQVPHVVCLTLLIKLDLEMPAPVLLRRLLILGRNNKIVHNVFNSSAFNVQSCRIVDLDTLFAAKVRDTVSEVDLLTSL